MHKLLMIAAVATLAGCTNEAAPPAADANLAAESNMAADANLAMANDTNMAAPVALASLNETTWEYIDAETKKPIQESVDAAGKYIAVSGQEHFDHGTAAMKDGKACFTSAMSKEGEVCWSDPMLAVGASGETISSKGEKLAVKRVAYVPLSM